MSCGVYIGRTRKVRIIYVVSYFLILFSFLNIYTSYNTYYWILLIILITLSSYLNLETVYFINTDIISTSDITLTPNTTTIIISVFPLPCSSLEYWLDPLATPLRRMFHF